MFTHQIVTKIQENNYTPFEAMLYIHKFFTTKYRIDFDEFGHQSTTVSNQIEKTLTALCMPGLKCGTVCALSREKENSPITNYSLNIVYVHDPDYAICGTFANDTVRDASSVGFEHGKGFAHCLFPISDLKKSKHISFSDFPEELSSHTNSIFPPTFINALRRIFETAPELCAEENFNDFIYHELNNTITTAQQSFDENATSKFVKCPKSMISTAQEHSDNNESST